MLCLIFYGSTTGGIWSAFPTSSWRWSGTVPELLRFASVLVEFPGNPMYLQTLGPTSSNPWRWWKRQFHLASQHLPEATASLALSPAGSHLWLEFFGVTLVAAVSQSAIADNFRSWFTSYESGISGCLKMAMSNVYRKHRDQPSNLVIFPINFR